jgi:hypothetical protein
MDMYRYALLLILLLFITGFGLKSESDPDKAVVRFGIVVGCAPMSLSDDSDIKIGGGKWGGNVIINVNDNPVEMMEYGGAIIEISSWVKPGMNVLSFSGNAKRKIYYKIIKYGKMSNIEKVLLAGVVRPEEIKNYRINLEFETNCVPEFYKVKSPERHYKKKELIVEKINKMHKALVDGDESTFVKMVSEGPVILCNGIRNRFANERNEKEIRESFFSGNIMGYDEFRAADINVVWGDRSAFVYTGFNKVWKDIREPFLFKMKNKDGETILFPPIHLVFINDRWIVW